MGWYTDTSKLLLHSPLLLSQKEKKCHIMPVVLHSRALLWFAFFFLFSHAPHTVPRPALLSGADEDSPSVSQTR